EAPSLTLTTQAQRTPALRASGPKIAFPPGLKAGIPYEEQRMECLPPARCVARFAMSGDAPASSAVTHLLFTLARNWT
ncbi:hypothetical protein, partial [Streptomyces luteolifulvus]|uniref:hypothetical protein n=1 Tax=Streptomyces luteolifulvus TaxID=2615112 RepID=UPI001CDA00BB